jgi:hypothetical protein
MRLHSYVPLGLRLFPACISTGPPRLSPRKRSERASSQPAFTGDFAVSNLHQLCRTAGPPMASAARVVLALLAGALIPAARAQQQPPPGNQDGSVRDPIWQKMRQSQPEPGSREDRNPFNPLSPDFPNGVAPNRHYPPVAPMWQTTVDPGQIPPRYTAFDKLEFAAREQFSFTVFAPALTSAGWEHLINGNPKYGTNSGGFSERFGAAMLRAASGRILGDGIFPALLHEDPRYYRIGQGPKLQRALLSARQTFSRRDDDGVYRFNWSGSLAHFVASGLEMTYYPHVSAHGGVVLESFALSFAGDATGKLFREFLPDVFSRLRRRYEEPQPSADGTAARQP